MITKMREKRFTGAIDSVSRYWESLSPSSQKVVEISDPFNLSEAERVALSEGLSGPRACVIFRSKSCRPGASGEHPITALGEQTQFLGKRLWLKSVPTRAHDGAAKVINYGKDQADEALSDRLLDAHQDGVSIRGILAITGLWMDVAPPNPPSTYCQNLVRLASRLRWSDSEAFSALCAKDALVVHRKIDGAEMVHPVLYVRHGLPCVFFRSPGEHYEIYPGNRSKPLDRALERVREAAKIGAEGAVSVRMDTAGTGVLFSNTMCVHGREAFPGGMNEPGTRVVSAAWWTLSRRDDRYEWGGTRRVYPRPFRVLQLPGFANSRWNPNGELHVPGGDR